MRVKSARRKIRPAGSRAMRPDLTTYLGRRVTVAIGRPLGSRHPSEPDMMYPLNYGYVPGTVSGDGYPVDAYLLGVDEPVEQAEGVVIAVVLRADDAEDKLVVAPEGQRYSPEQIEALVRFQEQYFDSRIVMAGEEVSTVLLLCTDLMFAVQLQNMVKRAGLRYANVRPGAPLPPAPAVLMIADLAARADVPAAIREAVSRGIPVVAFGPHMDTEARRAAKEAGAMRVLANSNLARDLPMILASVK